MEVAGGTVHHPFLYDAADNELQEFILLGLFVAGKNAVIQQHKLNWFLELLRNNVFPDRPDFSPLSRIALVGDDPLEKYLRHVGAGQYRRLVKALRWFAENMETGRLNLRACSREQLCECPGLGYKTASFFLIYTRRDCHYACLDTHILRWLREEAGYGDAPKASPQTPAHYEKWERAYLLEVEKLGCDPTEFDFELWLRYSKKKNK